MRESLGDIAKEIEATGKPKRMRVRRLLAIVGQERRGKQVTRAIRRLLRRHQLKCDPDFANVHIDSRVCLTLSPKLGGPRTDAVLQNEGVTESACVQEVAAAPYAGEEVEPQISVIDLDGRDRGG